MRASAVEAHGLSCLEACGILALQPGIKPASPASQGDFLTTGQPGKSPKYKFFIELQISQSGHRQMFEGKGKRALTWVYKTGLILFQGVAVVTTCALYSFLSSRKGGIDLDQHFS